VPWQKVLQLLVVNRLCDPGSEYAIHRRWFDRSAMDELLCTDFAVASKDRLYRCLDRIVAHKDDLCRHLTQRWKTLFDASFNVLLYDLTSTYFEGLCKDNPKAKHGYSRDGRSDCRQVVIALVVTTDGLPLAYEVLAGNTADHTTLKDCLAKIEGLYGNTRRVRFGHSMYQGVGHTERIAVEAGRLIAEGIISRDTASAREVVASGKRGFPWQASLGAQVAQADFVRNGKNITVNGRTFEGPLYVARRTVLGESSFVDLGADANTTATIAAQSGCSP